MNIEEWSVEDLVEIKLKNDEDFLIIKETLTRIGISSFTDKTLYQSCHILHKRGKYYITHFKEMFNLDGKENRLTDIDIKRRNSIINLMQQWKLCTIVDESKISNRGINGIRIIPSSEKREWTLLSKYKIGNK